VQNAHAVDIHEVLSRSDVFEIEGSEQAVTYAYRMSSNCWAGLVDNKVACIWGLIPPTLLSDQAYLWLLITKEVEQHKFLFIRHSQRAVEAMLTKYSLIVGHCAIGNDPAIKWLRWLKAEFGPPQGNKIPFQIRAESWTR
jgi:hypothetical protein